MASADDINSTLQNIARQLSGWVKGEPNISSFPLSGTIAINTIGTAAATQVLSADTTRSAIVFHNPSDTITLLLAPATDINGAAISATFSSKGGGYLLLPQDYLPLSGTNCQLAWKAIASTAGTANALTIATS